MGSDTAAPPVRRRRASWLGRLRERSADNRGVAIIEAAFITPVFFSLIFGVIEGGLYMKDYLAVANAVRAGARSASAGGALAQADMYTLLDVADESSALSANQLKYIVIYKATGFGAAPSNTGGAGGGCLSGIPVSGVCNVYTSVDIARARAQVKELSAQATAEAAGQTRTLDTTKLWFGCLTTGPHAGDSPDRYWCPGVRKDARSDNSGTGPDYVGVYMKVDHPWVTKMFGNQKTITDQTVIQIEPRSE